MKKGGNIALIVIAIVLVAIMIILNSNNSTDKSITGNLVMQIQDAQDMNGSNLAVYYPTGGNWWIAKKDGKVDIKSFGWQQALPLFEYKVGSGLTNYLSVYGDYDGDNVTDLTVYYPGTATWDIIQSTDGFREENFGWSAVVPVPADYDGDGKKDIAVFAPVLNATAQGMWYIWPSNGSIYTQQFGWSAVVPVPADYDGDGRDDIAVFAPVLNATAQGYWYILPANGSAIITQSFGWSQTVPVPADYDGDGRDDISVYCPKECGSPGSRWYVLLSTGGIMDIGFKDLLDGIPMPADYDNDGKADMALYKTNSGPANSPSADWLIRYSSKHPEDHFVYVDLGDVGALPVPGMWESVVAPEPPPVAPDLTPPVISNGQPTGTVTRSSVNMTVQTDENATCRYSTIVSSYDQMTGFSITGTRNHRQELTGLTEGTKIYYIRCRDASQNVNLQIYTLAFDVDIPISCTDNDNDGYNVSQEGCGIVFDCDDSNSTINPGANEVCGDGVDNNCANGAEEGCPCVNGTSQQCGSSDVGACSYGMQYCNNETGTWGNCTGNIEPSAEICDDIDNDCDNETDESIQDRVYGSTLGICSQGVERCMDGNWTPYLAARESLGYEICNNGLDDDCDNVTDEDNCTIVGGCDGCLIGNDCYTFGFRMNATGVLSYCSGDGIFQSQKADNSSCQAGYECLSNFCSDGECVSIVQEIRGQTSLLWRILCWLANPIDEEGREDCIDNHTIPI